MVPAMSRLTLTLWARTTTGWGGATGGIAGGATGGVTGGVTGGGVAAPWTPASAGGLTGAPASGGIAAGGAELETPVDPAFGGGTEPARAGGVETSSSTP